MLVGGAALSATTALAGHAKAADPAVKGGTAPDDELEAAIRRSIDSYSIPGAAVAIARPNALTYTRGFGLANLETGTPVAPDSVFRLGSISKQFTAAAIIKLAAAGRLDLAAPVSRYLSAFAPLPSFTALELMHHTAGLHSDDSDSIPTVATQPKGQTDLAAEIANQATPFDFDPGTAWLYSNANYIVLGALVEAVAGAPFPEAMKSLVFDPLGLSSLAIDTPDVIVPERASGYMATGDEAQPFVNAPYLDPSQAGGAGAMRGNVKDLIRWHRLLLGGQLFDQSYIELMLAPGRLRDGRLSVDNRFNPDDSSYGDTQYACGLLVSAQGERQPSILHYGIISGFCGMLQTFTSAHVTVAVLCNAFIGPDVPFRGVRQVVRDQFLEE